MHLVVVESPTKAKKIGQYLGADYTVRASLGHVRDLPKSKMGVDVEQGFAPTYEIPTKSKKIVRELKSLAKEADEIYLASDPDREGEAIAWHILQSWQDPKLEKKAKRAVFHEITAEAVKHAMAHPQDLNIDLVDAQQARRILDRLVGYQLSPLLWKKVRRGLSAGRVQSVALRMIVEREAEIEAFKPEEYWEVDVQLAINGSESITARIMTLQDKPYKPVTAADVDPLRTWTPAAQYQVLSAEAKDRLRHAYPPFTTSTLQQQAANRLGYSSKRTMVLAQQLYEEGLITYHRTDSTNIAAPAITMARQYIHSKFGDEFLPEQPNFFATKSKNAQEAHEAIRPTGPQATMPEQGKLTGSHAKLYDLIFRRFMASQMNDARYEQTTIDVEGREGQQTLVARANGSVIKHAGWMALFPNSEETVLPTMKAGQSLTYQDLLTAQKFTQPPARFNDASLVKELEKRGIGRPSTYASIISVLLDRAYVDRVQKAFVPTAVGKTVALFLTLNFADVVDYDFTAHMEDDLDEIALGNKQWQKVLGEFYTPFLAKLKDVEKTAKRMTVPVEPLDKPCPKCGLAEADYAQAQDKHQTLLTMSPADREKVVLREQPHGELVIRAGKFGKFISCSRYPECDYTEKFLDKLDMVCPQCGEGQVVAKKTKKGRTFYGCSRYPACDFASWKKPGTKEEE